MSQITTTLAFFGTLGWPELLVIGILGVLLFGRRLPEVGRNIGKGIVELKKGLAGIEDDIDPSKPASPRIERSEESQEKTDTTSESTTTKA